jgi:hypothetical protein
VSISGTTPASQGTAKPSIGAQIDRSDYCCAQGHKTERARLAGLPVVRGARGDSQTGECGGVGQIHNAVHRISKHCGWIAVTRKDELQHEMGHGHVGAHRKHNGSGVTG